MPDTESTKVSFAIVSEQQNKLLEEILRDAVQIEMLGRSSSTSTWTNEQIEIYRRHGGQRKHPLDDAQGL